MSSKLTDQALPNEILLLIVNETSDTITPAASLESPKPYPPFLNAACSNPFGSASLRNIGMPDRPTMLSINANLPCPLHLGERMGHDTDQGKRCTLSFRKSPPSSDQNRMHSSCAARIRDHAHLRVHLYKIASLHFEATMDGHFTVRSEVGINAQLANFAYGVLVHYDFTSLEALSVSCSYAGDIISVFPYEVPNPADHDATARPTSEPASSPVSDDYGFYLMNLRRGGRNLTITEIHDTGALSDTTLPLMLPAALIGRDGAIGTASKLLTWISTARPTSLYFRYSEKTRLDNLSLCGSTLSQLTLSDFNVFGGLGAALRTLVGLRAVKLEEIQMPDGDIVGIDQWDGVFRALSTLPSLFDVSLENLSYKGMMRCWGPDMGKYVLGLAAPRGTRNVPSPIFATARRRVPDPDTKSLCEFQALRNPRAICSYREPDKKAFRRLFTQIQKPVSGRKLDRKGWIFCEHEL